MIKNGKLVKNDIIMIILEYFRKKIRQHRLSKIPYCYQIDPSSKLTSSFFLNIIFPEKRKFIEIGSGNILGCEFRFESREGYVTVGNDNYIGPSLIICHNRVVIGNHVTIAWGCTIYDHDSHSLDYMERRKDVEREITNMREGRNFIVDKDWTTVKSAPIVIEDDAWIGINVIVLKGVTIGRGAVVGAGSVVTKDVPAWTVVAGNPAVVVKQLNEIGK